LYTSSITYWFYDPVVSTAIGTILTLESTACLAAAPCWVAVKLQWDTAKVSGTVTSHYIDFHLAQGLMAAVWLRSMLNLLLLLIQVLRLTSCLRRPSGSLTSGIWALLNNSPYDVIHLAVLPQAISYRCSLGSDTLSPRNFEILRLKCIWVTGSTFLDHVTSPVTWSFFPWYVVSYRWSVDTFFLTGKITEIFGCKCPITAMSSQPCLFPV